MRAKLLNELLDRAKVLGLGELDFSSAKEYLNYNEYGLCFDLLVTQLYEHEIEIDTDFYIMVEVVAKELQLPIENYSFLRELIRN